MKKVIITGATGTLGNALAKMYQSRGYYVIGVTRKSRSTLEHCDEVLVSDQQTSQDAEVLLTQKPDLIILNAGQIETAVGEGGLPLQEQFESINKVNYEFPALVSLAAAKTNSDKPLDIVAIGSIADGSPSCFGPVYHASKMALNYWITSVGPIVEQLNPAVRIRLYRPGVIAGPLSWSPVLRLNKKGYKVRAARCERAPAPSAVAHRIAKFITSSKTIGSDRSPISFHLLRLLYWVTPNLFFSIQKLS